MILHTSIGKVKVRLFDIILSVLRVPCVKKPAASLEHSAVCPLLVRHPIMV